MLPLNIFRKPILRSIGLLGALMLAGQAMASITYKLDRPQALPGEAINVIGLLFNDGDSAISWSAPKSLVLQWRNQEGKVFRSLARLTTNEAQANVPVNNFVKFAWRAVVPSGVKGLQAVNVEGEPTLLALDTSPLENSPVSGTVATGPVIDAGAGRGLADPALPDNIVAATGASVTEGPRVSTPERLAAAPTAFENFRSAISPYEPIYFDVGDNGGRNARYQVSFKYRLFSPSDRTNPEFIDNFYFGYTQTALWDLSSDSNPFVDTSFKPSLFWRKDALWQAPQKDWFVGLASGLEHESNGKKDDESRSLNFAYIQPELNYRFDGGSTLTFAPRFKTYFEKDENPDYADYAGYVDWKLRWAQDNGLVLSGMYRHGKGGRDTTQLEAAWPLRRTFLNMNGYFHVQYFRGYGQTLLGYNRKSDGQVRIGIALVP